MKWLKRFIAHWKSFILRESKMLTISGVHVTKEYGAPTLRDIAIQSMRIPRFCGSTNQFYPVGMHLLFVAKLVPPALEHHALLHDAPEVCVGDVPRPMKTDQAREVEQALFVRLYESLGLALPTPEEEAIVKAADIKACMVEGLHLNVPGFRYVTANLDIDAEAYQAFEQLMNGYNPAGCISEHGFYVGQLMERLYRSVYAAHSRVAMDVAEQALD